MGNGLELDSTGMDPGSFCNRDALLIAGPTASGKSALALSIAKATGGVVINADSMQVYAGLRILTARPSLIEENEADHRLFGFVQPEIPFSAGDYIRTITPLLKGLREQRRLAIIVGGTGLYFNALTKGLVDMPVISPGVMAEISAIESGGESLHDWLLREDPASAARLSPADIPRLQRAISVKLATGRVLGEWQKENTLPVLNESQWHGIFLAPERAELYARINARFHAMLAAGALEEIRSIGALGLASNRGIMKSHGMPHLLAHLDGRLSLDDAIRLGQQDTRNYAKRQMTWARRFMSDWHWYNT
jgi:tRNA dimethylallyltransferase